MNSIYVDTNIFLYLSDKSSPFYKGCRELIQRSKVNGVTVTTSCETVQEIIHLTKNMGQLQRGLKIAHKTMQIVSVFLPVNRATLELYLKKAAAYKNVKSRDLIHLATCLENKIDVIITHDDRDFKKFKRELKHLTPEEFTALLLKP